MEQAGLLLLVLLAGGVPGDRYAAIARILSAAGWLIDDGRPLTSGDAARAARLTNWVDGGVRPQRTGFDQREVTEDGVTFARAALQRWPASS